jgi:hypothetical protein
MNELDLTPDVIDVHEPTQELVEQLLVEIDGILISTTEFVERPTIEASAKPRIISPELPVQMALSEIPPTSILDYQTITPLDQVADIHASLEGPTGRPSQASRPASVETIPGTTADMAHIYELAA